MTPKEAKKAEQTYQEYRFKALLSVLTDEQREQFDIYMKEHLPELKTTIAKFLAPHDAELIISEFKKVKKFG
ncbi:MULTISPECIES: hypothetical protein [unclassified Pedobacter]|uniref:hypothetical protein n=1 Tax=unclassified Pedobacter TaxID=2628915 RepID=UPI001E62B555|nr:MULTISPECIES: hypothetical protein [unclassified Pedobacter]